MEFLAQLLRATLKFYSGRPTASHQVAPAQAQQRVIMLCQIVLLMLLYSSAGLLAERKKTRRDLPILPHGAIEQSEAILRRSCGEPCVEVLHL